MTSANKRRAISVETAEILKSQKAEITTDALANSGKKNPARVARTKVYGVLEEGGDGSVYLSKFEAAETSDVEPVAKSDEGAEEGVSWYCPIVKVDEASEDQRLVTGIVLEPEVVDAQLDIYDAGVIKTAAHDFLRSYNTGNVVGFMHKDMNRSLDLVESWIAPVEMKIGATTIKKGTWMMTVNVCDEKIWKSVKAGSIAGFSIGGVAKVQPIDDGAGKAA